MKYTLCLLPILIASIHAYYPTHKYDQCKPVNGGWGEWSSFGPCSKSCGSGGIQKRHRYCDSPIPIYGGKACIGDNVEVKPCEGYLKCPVNGGYGPWQKGKCSAPCGGGTVIYKRYCNEPAPQYCGKKCEGPSEKKEPCNTHYCPVDGEWSKWECEDCFTYVKTGKCIKKCKRTCTNPAPKYGGKDCEGKSVQVQYCGYKECHQDTETTTTTKKPYHSPCYDCLSKAEEYAKKNYKPGFVGHACRVDYKHCKGLTTGIRDMYPANNWFFLHCSNDGPWCKPCATRTLVYNPKCGQCESTRDGPCTGPNMWRNPNGSDDEFKDVMDDLDVW